MTRARGCFASALGASAIALACGAPRPAAPPHDSHAYDPRVRIVGRVDARDPRGPLLSWPGTTVVANVQGTRIAVALDEHPGPFGTSFFQPFVDGHPLAPIALAPGPHTYLVAGALDDRAHDVRLVKRTEASAGTTTFLGFVEGALAAPPAPATLAIEIVGDSNTAGYGVLGDDPSCHFSAATESFTDGWAALTGAALAADVTAIAYSGKGVAENYAREDPMTLDKLYPLANPMDRSSAIDPRASHADVVVLFAGGNDYSQPTKGKDDQPSDRAFVSAYAALLAQIRGAHPDAPIVCIVTPSLEDEFPPGWRAHTTLTTNIARAIVDSKLDRVSVVAPAQAEKSELTGCDFHPSRALQKRIADAATPAIRTALAKR